VPQGWADLPNFGFDPVKKSTCSTALTLKTREIAFGTSFREVISGLQNQLQIATPLSMWALASPMQLIKKTITS
jgi:hypothetical protein